MALKVRWKPVRLPEKLLQIREALELSQNGMLRRLGIKDDFGRQAISAWERGDMECPMPIVLLYARAANISTDVLIDDEQNLPSKLPVPEKRKS